LKNNNKWKTIKAYESHVNNSEIEVFITDFVLYYNYFVYEKSLQI